LQYKKYYINDYFRRDFNFRYFKDALLFEIRFQSPHNLWNKFPQSKEIESRNRVHIVSAHWSTELVVNKMANQGQHQCSKHLHKYDSLNVIPLDAKSNCIWFWLHDQPRVDQSWVQGLKVFLEKMISNVWALVQALSVNVLRVVTEQFSSQNFWFQK